MHRGEARIGRGALRAVKSGAAWRGRAQPPMMGAWILRPRLLLPACAVTALAVLAPWPWRGRRRLPASPAPGGPWPTPDDRTRLRSWREAWMKALAAARSSGHAAEISSDPVLFNPDAGRWPVRSRSPAIIAAESPSWARSGRPERLCRLPALHLRDHAGGRRAEPRQDGRGAAPGSACCCPPMRSAWCSSAR